MYSDFLIQHESTIRLTVFLSLFGLVGLFELWRPRRQLRASKAARWFNNLGLVVLNTLVLRALFPAAAVGIAFWAESNAFGLLNSVVFADVPSLLLIVSSVVFLDLAIWYQHYLFHKIPVLWRLHRVHHADVDFDLTTGLRFHPVEVVLSMAIKAALVAVLGIPVMAVILFEIVLNGCAMLTHGNYRLPRVVDSVVRHLFVTPDMHRVHHSWRKEEASSNFGFNLSVWDRLFGTYKEDSVDGQLGIQFGIQKTLNPDAIPLHKMLSEPLKDRA